MDAADLYIQAANAFRLQKMHREAGQAFEKAAEVQNTKLNEPGDAANAMVDAFKVYKQDNPEDAVRCLEFSINSYTRTGNFRRAAQHKENAGKVFETQIGDMKRALECYETAAEWFTNDNAVALATPLWLKVADLSAIGGDYPKAIETYEKIASESINSNLMRYSVKTYLLKAGICHLATGDLVASQRALEKYQELDPGFSQTRECQLLADLAAAIEAGDQDKFTDYLFQFDRIQKLDKWHTAILLRVKQQIEEQQEDFS